MASLNTVYRLVPGLNERSGLLPTIIIDSGVVNVYVSNASTKPTSSSSMQLDATQINTTDVYKLEAQPIWILFEQSSGTTTKIELNGISLEE